MFTIFAWNNIQYTQVDPLEKAQLHVSTQNLYRNETMHTDKKQKC